MTSSLQPKSVRPVLLSRANVAFISRNDGGRTFEQAIGHGESFQAIAEDAWAGLHPDLPMPNPADTEIHIRDIEGPLNWPETGEREPCTRCGMIANIDPAFHTERFDHRPIVRRGGERWRFSFYSFAFTELMPEE